MIWSYQVVFIFLKEVILISKRVKYTVFKKLEFILEFRESKNYLFRFCKNQNMDYRGMRRWIVKYDNNNNL